jgi:Flp pilus assembly protein TadB
MNSLKGLGICVVLAAVAFAMTKVSDVSQVIAGASITVVTVSLIAYIASMKRRRRDRRIAQPTNRRRRRG